MSDASDLADRSCVPCRGGVPPLPRDRVEALAAALPGWTLDAEARALSRRFAFKGFARALQLANVAGWVGEREGHHPDIRLGWGYCEVTFTTHEAGGLTENDFICAAKLDRIAGAA